MRKSLVPVVLLLAAAAGPPGAHAQNQDPNSYQAPADEMLDRHVTVSDLSDPADGWWRGGYFTGSAPVGQDDPRYLSLPGGPFDGVARLLISKPGGTSGCTGSLLWSGTDILTAAHCVYDFTTNTYVDGSSITASFLKPGDSPSLVNISGVSVVAKPGYTGAVVDPNDVAIIRLERPADSWMTHYDLFSGNPMYQQASFVGFGSTGNGVTGAVLTNQFTANPVRRVVLNSWEMTRSTSSYHINFAGTPVTPILISDFDGADPGGTYPVRGGSWAPRSVAQNNATCSVWASNAAIPADLRADLCHTGYGVYEGITGGGDSGGPAFIERDGTFRIAAVSSFGSQRCVPDQRTPPRTSAGCPAGSITNGSYFGSLSGHVSVSYGDNNEWVASQVAPEPASMILLGTGLAGMAGAARRRRRRREEAAAE